MKNNNLILEACVETLEESMRAEQNGADRLELCSRLDLDGLTPDVDLGGEAVELCVFAVTADRVFGWAVRDLCCHGVHLSGGNRKQAV